MRCWVRARAGGAGGGGGADAVPSGVGGADAYEFYAVSLPLWVAPVLYGCSHFVYMLSGTPFLYIVHGDILMTTCVDSPSYVIQNKVNKNLYGWPLAFMDVPICAPVYCSCEILMTTCVDSPSYVIQSKVNKNLYGWPLAFMDVPIWYAC